MAIRKITINYLSNDFTTNFLHQAWIQVVGEPAFIPFWVVKDSPSTSYDVQKGLTLGQTVGNILTKIQEQITASAPNLVTVERVGNQIIFYAGSDTVDAQACMIYMQEYEPGDVLFSSVHAACAVAGSYLQAEVSSETIAPVTLPSENPVGITPVNGISGNCYKINNDIWIEVPNVTDGTTEKVEIVLKNLNNQKTSTVFTLYPTLFTSARLNLSPLVKSLFDKPAHSDNYTELTPFVINTNWADFEIAIKRYFTTPTSSVVQFDAVTLTKTFLRAGERTNNINITQSPSTVLRPVATLPIWAGYPTAEYYLNADFRIEKRNNLNAVVSKDYRSVVGCEGNYVKFLNQNGAYSYWYFEGRKESEGNNNLGYSNDKGILQDFGNETSIESSFYSKVPLNYIPLIKDLFVSPEIYLYLGGNKWERILSDGNKLEINHYKRVYEINFKFKRIHNFNPSVIWQ